MRVHHLLIIVSLGAIPAWPQVVPSAVGPAINRDEDVPMAMPPQVSWQSYQAATGEVAKSNYMNGELDFDSAYNTNALVGETLSPVNELTYSLWPKIELDRTTPRQSGSLVYSSGFTFYQDTSALDSVNQHAATDFQYRLSPYSSISLEDSFQQNSNVYNQPDVISGVVAPGSPGSLTAVVISPFVDQLTNTLNGDYGHQFSSDGMIGAGGTFTLLHYPNASQASGLYNSETGGELGFYNRRLSRDQYIGAVYQYSRTVTQSVTATTQLHTPSFFYFINLHRVLSLSVAAGPQHYALGLSAPPPVSSWSPYVFANVGWSNGHSNLGASYSRSVTAGEGLLGAYKTQSASASAGWQMTRAWTLGAIGSYAISKNLSPLLSVSNPGGHGAAGTASLQHLFGEHVSAELGYTRLHQSYRSIGVILNAPDNNRVFVSVSYHFTRPLGR